MVEVALLTQPAVVPIEVQKNAPALKPEHKMGTITAE
jgi:hypothetical protein